MISRRPRNLALLASLSIALTACTAAGPIKSLDDPKTTGVEAKSVATGTGSPYPSTYKAAPSVPTLIRGATVLIGNGERLDDADVLLRDGVVAAVGKQLAAPSDARVVDGRGKWVTPGTVSYTHLTLPTKA